MMTGGGHGDLAAAQHGGWVVRALFYDASYQYLGYTNAASGNQPGGSYAQVGSRVTTPVGTRPVQAAGLATTAIAGSFTNGGPNHAMWVKPGNSVSLAFTISDPNSTGFASVAIWGGNLDGTGRANWATYSPGAGVKTYSNTLVKSLSDNGTGYLASLSATTLDGVQPAICNGAWASGGWLTGSTTYTTLWGAQINASPNYVKDCSSGNDYVYIYFDSTAPAARSTLSAISTFTELSAGYPRTVTIGMGADGNGSGARGINCALSSSVPTTDTIAATCSLTLSAPQTVYYRTVDQVGNWSALGSDDLTYITDGYYSLSETAGYAAASGKLTGYSYQSTSYSLAYNAYRDIWLKYFIPLRLRFYFFLQLLILEGLLIADCLHKINLLLRIGSS